MDRATNIIDLSLTVFDKPARSAELTPTIQSSSSMTPEANKLTKRSSTGALPDTISESWGDIVNAGMSVGMYGDLVRMATAPSGVARARIACFASHISQKFHRILVSYSRCCKRTGAYPRSDGSLHAEWFKSTRQRADVRFAGKNVIFGVLNQGNIVEGAEQPNTVAEFPKVAPHAKPLSWSAR